jgi:hypothetical protein
VYYCFEIFKISKFHFKDLVIDPTGEDLAVRIFSGEDICWLAASFMV